MSQSAEFPKLPPLRGPVDWRALRLFATDVDGTLTDGGMYYTDAGEAMKRFDTRDAFGMNLLRQEGLELAIVTAENSPIVAARARKLKIENVCLNVSDKVACVEAMLARLGLDWPNLAYIGDDLNDLPLLRKAAFSACPGDAAAPVARAVDYVCQRLGGYGAVREACERILAGRTGQQRT